MQSEPAGLNWSVLVSGRLWVAALMGFAGGLPLLLTLGVLQAWMTAEQVDLGTIGLYGLVGLPYSLKFLWAPLVDRYRPLFFGRRRGWLVLSQLALALSLALLGLQDPGLNLTGVAIAALLVTFFSATQDIVIDAYRRETLADSEQGLGAAAYTYGYRLGMLLASGGGLILADQIGFSSVYLVMAAIMLAAIVVSLLAPEPAVNGEPPKTLAGSFVEPFLEFFWRGGRFNFEALLLLVFLVAYKFGDNVASHMATPFYLETGFTNTEIGAVVKFFGLAPLLFGIFVGGVLMLKVSLFRALLFIGVLQALSTACFAILTVVGARLGWLAVIIGFENLSAGMGTAALIALMARLTDRRFTATQFALLSALTSLPRTVLVSPMGFVAESVGWFAFFTGAALVAVPGLALLVYLRSWLAASATHS